MKDGFNLESHFNLIHLGPAGGIHLCETHLEAAILSLNLVNFIFDKFAIRLLQILSFSSLVRNIVKLKLQPLSKNLKLKKQFKVTLCF